MGRAVPAVSQSLRLSFRWKPQGKGGIGTRERSARDPGRDRSRQAEADHLLAGGSERLSACVRRCRKCRALSPAVRGGAPGRLQRAVNTPRRCAVPRTLRTAVSRKVVRSSRGARRYSGGSRRGGCGARRTRARHGRGVGCGSPSRSPDSSAIRASQLERLRPRGAGGESEGSGTTADTTGAANMVRRPRSAGSIGRDATGVSALGQSSRQSVVELFADDREEHLPFVRSSLFVHSANEGRACLQLSAQRLRGKALGFSVYARRVSVRTPRSGHSSLWALWEGGTPAGAGPSSDEPSSFGFHQSATYFQPSYLRCCSALRSRSVPRFLG
jgi:hypothetical protein